MLFRKLERSKIKKILVVSLTNIGDTVLTCPVIDALISYFPLAEISVVTGPKAHSLFEGNPYIKRTYVYTKKETVGQLFSLFGELRKERFDAVIDLRNTALAYFLGAPFHVPLFFRKKSLAHKRDQHFERLRSVFSDIVYSKNYYAISIDEKSREKTEELMLPFVDSRKIYFVVAPGAADSKKRWSAEGFVKVCQTLINKHKAPVFFIGDAAEKECAEKIAQQLPLGFSKNLCGELSLLESAWVLKNSRLVISNDSAVMHLASYFDSPVIGLFGPTDPKKYGPWGARGCFCVTNQYNEKGEGVISAISSEDVLKTIQNKFSL